MERNHRSDQAAPASPQAATAQTNSWTAPNTGDDDLTEPETEPEWTYNELSDAKYARHRFDPDVPVGKDCCVHTEGTNRSCQLGVYSIDKKPDLQAAGSLAG